MDQKLLSRQIINQAYESFEYFNNNIYPHSFVGREVWKGGQHLNKWAHMLQDADHTCILAPRKHTKSSIIYSWLMWINWKYSDTNLEVLYLSYTQQLASYHIKKYKDRKANNPFFNEMRNLTPAEGIAKWKWPNGSNHVIEPEGILSFKRGRHPDIVILDDVLADPTTMLDLGVIEKINQRVKEEVLSLPKEGGFIKIIGTAQTPVDFFFDMERNPDFLWGEFPAISNWKSKTVLWEQMFPWKRLMHIRDFEIGEKAFQKEYMIKPVWSADSFFKRSEIEACINPKLENIRKILSKNVIGGGWDIGKHSHPAYFTVFEFVPLGKDMDLAVQRYLIWMDGWDYNKQLEFIKPLIYDLRMDYCNFDATRGELEGFYEKGDMDRGKFIPIIFNTKTKHKMATGFEKRVKFKVIKEDGTEESSPLVQLMNHQRSINQILTVTNGLEAVATREGHGDSFWGVAMALDKSRTGNMTIMEDPDNVTGLY